MTTLGQGDIMGRRYGAGGKKRPVEGGSGLGRWIVGAAIALAVLVVLAVVYSPGRSADQPTSTKEGLGGNEGLVGVSLADTADVPDAWPQEWVDHVAFVEKSRGHEFVHPVRVVRASIPESLAAAEPEVGDSFDDSWWDPYVVFGLVGRGGDLSAEQSTVEQEWAAAYYDPETVTIYLPEDGSGLLLESTMVHELVHAWQHQYQMIDPGLETADERIAHLALLEGDADWVEHRWEEALSPERSAALAAEYAAVQYDESPSEYGYLLNQFATPYLLGDPAVETIRFAYGVDELNRLLLEGPTSSEIIIDPLSESREPGQPGRFLLTGLDREVEYYDGLGPLGLYNILVNEVGAPEALEAVIGYDLDRYEVWYEPDGTACLELAVWMDTPRDLSQLRQAFQAAGVPAALGDYGKPRTPGLRVTRCSDHPMGDPKVQGVDQLASLAVLGWATADNLAAGRNPEEARCLGLGAVEDFVPEQAGHRDWTAEPDPKCLN